jgi:hypothetical protein
MDVAQNSVSAGAGLIGIDVIENKDTLLIQISDNGRGMSPEQVNSVTDPFFTTRTTRDVGLGVPLFKLAAEQTGGGLTVTSEQGKGTVVRASFNTGHIDMTPLGDINETIVLLITCNPEIDFVYIREKGGKRFTLDTREVRGVLGEDIPLSEPDVAAWLRDWLKENENELKNRKEDK